MTIIPTNTTHPKRKLLPLHPINHTLLLRLHPKLTTPDRLVTICIYVGVHVIGCVHVHVADIIFSGGYVGIGVGLVGDG